MRERPLTDAKLAGGTGQHIEGGLLARLNRAMVTATGLLGAERPKRGDVADYDRAAATVTTTAALTLDALRALPAGDPRAQPLCASVLELDALARELREQSIARRTDLLSGVESALARLRGVQTTNDLLERVCPELVQSCGFQRAMLSRVENNTWLPWKAFWPHDRDYEREFVGWMTQAGMELETGALEQELLDTGRPALVTDAINDPRVRPAIPAACSTHSFVAAPIIPAGRVVGFLHADHFPSDRRADRADRDVLWAFAEGFGRIFERTSLLERLRGQRDHVRETLAAAESILDELCSAEIELARNASERSTSAGATAAIAVAAGPVLEDDALTPRENEVLQLMIRGLSNAAIAERLVISRGTVKTHVKHILRKLGAINRSEAISRYLRATNAVS